MMASRSGKEEQTFGGEEFTRYCAVDPLAVDEARRAIAEAAEGYPPLGGSRLLGARPAPLPRLALLRQLARTESAQADEPEFVSEKPTELTFIEIELLDEEGNPVPKEKYKIELPDGAIREGRLDPSGRVLVDGIDRGTCKVSFPNLDAKDWRRR